MKLKIKQTKKNIFYMIIGRLIIWGLLYAGAIAFVIWILKQITVYR